MNYREFKKEIIIRKKHLTQNNLSFDKYFEASKTNGRLRNNFVYYVLTSRILIIKFFKLAKADKDANEMYHNLLTALFLAREEKGDVKKISKILIKKYFHRAMPKTLEEGQVAYEMKKYLKTIVNQYIFEQNVTDEDKEYFKKLMNGKNVDELIKRK
ncbi:MAG: hypothetical protein ACOYVD_16295 [Bacillota bacterium]